MAARVRTAIPNSLRLLRKVPSLSPGGVTVRTAGRARREVAAGMPGGTTSPPLSASSTGRLLTLNNYRCSVIAITKSVVAGQSSVTLGWNIASQENITQITAAVMIDMPPSKLKQDVHQPTDSRAGFLILREGVWYMVH